MATANVMSQSIGLQREGRHGTMLCCKESEHRLGELSLGGTEKSLSLALS